MTTTLDLDGAVRERTARPRTAGPPLGPGPARPTTHAGGADRESLADFLRRRREAVQPADAGLTAGPRRRTAGLRRDDVAALAGTSTDHHARLEQRRGPQPSEQMVAAIARALRLDLDERDHPAWPATTPRCGCDAPSTSPRG